MVTTSISSRAPISRAQLTGSGASTAPVKSSGFKQGSIVTLAMKNFLVYKDAKARFGPRLNMVVGPNGSGKSTLVCAIALGLGGSPKVLGRADNLSAFVMHGVKEDASITVELHITAGKNLFITRTFSRKSNSSNWHMNGRSHTGKEVERKVRELGIQVDNLCTMLPQDKVGDFSGFTPDKLLLETEKALSDTELHQPHLKLIDLQDSKGKTQNEEETMATKLEGMESELSTLEKDVRRFEERQEKQDKLDLHKKRKTWFAVERLSALGLETKRKEKEAAAELKEKKDADKPLQDELKKWERQDEKLRGAQKTRNQKKDALAKAMVATIQKMETIESKALDARGQITNLETRRRKDEEKLAKYKSQFEEAQDKLEGHKEKRDEMRKLEEIQADLERKNEELGPANSDVQGQDTITTNTARDIRDAEVRIKQLTNEKALREGNFRKRFKEEAEIGLQVRDWVARNGDKLRGPVVGPIGIEVTVADDEAARAVETHVPGYLWCSMVVSCKDDHDTIIREFRNNRTSLTIMVNQGGTLRASNPHMSPAEMAHLKQNGGVRGFLDDFIDCPDTIRQVLRRNTKIDQVFLGSFATQQAITRDPNFLPSLGKRGPNGVAKGSAIYAGGSYGAPNNGGRNGGSVEQLQMYQTKISLYGARKPSTRVSETRAPQFVSAGVDAEAVAREQEEKARFERLRQAAMDKRERLSAILAGIAQDVRNLKDEHTEVSEEIKRVNKTVGRVHQLEKIIANLESSLARGGLEEKAQLTKRYENVLGQHAVCQREAQENASDMLDASLDVMAATCAKRVCSDKLEDAKEALRNAEDSRTELENMVAELKAKTTQIRKQFQAEKAKAERTAPRSDAGGEATEFGKKYAELPDKEDELDAIIEDVTDDLQNTVNNPQVVEKYQKLKAETEAARKALSDLIEGNANANQVMDSIRVPWMESLQRVVDKLNTLFEEYMSKMDGCGGEVKLAKNDSSFKKWGVEIRVRFRAEADGGKMAVLDKRVHSGGERSVSTILFLMALQDLQHSPFRVVDEINQGMDPKNERQVFSRIVLNSCGVNRKQYFLITPKLLQGLVAMDNPDMTVIFIMNGVTGITGTDEHTMKNFIANKKRQLALRAGEAQGSGPQQRRRIS